MDYLKSAVPSQLASERGSKIVVINPGSANVRIGLAQQEAPLNIPHCIARHVREGRQGAKQYLQDQMLNSQITTSQHMEREKAYDIIASLLKIPFLDEEVAHSSSFSRKMARLDGYNPQTNMKDAAFDWTEVYENYSPDPASTPESLPDNGTTRGSMEQPGISEFKENTAGPPKYRDVIYGDEALKISPAEPYCIRRPIRRGHLNISQYYPMQQVIEDLHAIWDWILIEKLQIPRAERYLYSAVIVLPETFDNREIKEILSIVLRDLQFSSAVVHQEGLAAVFGNGLTTACIVNIGAQSTTVICVEDGVSLPTTSKTLGFGGEDISRCLLWTQRHHQTWPAIRTDCMGKPIDLLMLNRLKESCCQIKEGEVEALAIVHSYEDGTPARSHKTRLTALNIPPMGLFHPMLLVPEVYPPPPRNWFHDFDDMLDDPWNMEFQRRDMSDSLFSSFGGGLPMWDNYPLFATKPKKEEKLGLADAIAVSILSTGRIDLKRKLFCSIQLIGGVSLTNGLISAVEESVLHAIPPTEAIDTVEVLPSRTYQSFVAWKGGVVLAILDIGRDTWIQQEDWLENGIHIGTGRKYKDSYYLQAQAMCYMNS
uniref:Actin-related protein 9 n=1 Tax=Kalanchoe fedtschenkoi TaxID=63787 RepID=A0A7N0USW2_KALFE